MISEIFGTQVPCVVTIDKAGSRLCGAKAAGKGSAEAQYQVFDFLLGKTPAGSGVDALLRDLANSLKVRVEQMLAAAQA